MILEITEHSLIDVITNSSSELFVCDTKKSLDFVEELLVEFLNAYNRGSGNNYSFNYCFGNVYQLNSDEDVRTYLSKMVWWENDYPSNSPYGRGNNDWDEWNKKVKIEENKIIEKNMREKKYIGKIIIESNGDNSIPFELYDLIESAFNAERFHLG